MSFDNKGNYPLDENINKNKISDTKNPVLVKAPKEKWQLEETQIVENLTNSSDLWQN